MSDPLRERANLAIDADRLWQSLMHMAAVGGTPAGGVCRLALSDKDKAARDLFIAWCRDAGCTVRIDELGNIFARREGLDESLPPIAMGSHLDTVPTGGKFDGVLGVLAGLEVLRTLEAAHFRTRAPLEVIVWTNEEGSRFSPAMVSSGVFAGAIDLAFAKSRTDKSGASLGDELARIGYVGPDPVGVHPLAAFFELHIEQGPILEAEQKRIGVVTDVQALRWYELRIKGQEAHAGTTPMELRHDALLAAARLIVEVDSIAKREGPDARGTVGYIMASPNGRNVITGDVFLCIDMRHPNDVNLLNMEKALEAAIAELDGVDVELSLINHTPAVKFDDVCVGHVRDAAEALGLPHRDMISGAGHDAVYLARVAPSAMIFIPCRGGLSHNEAEWAEPADCAAGCDVLLKAVLAFDAAATMG